RGHRLEVPGYVAHPARGMHPAGGGIESLVDEELSPGHRAVCIESLLARHLQLGAKVEGSMRVDPEDRVMIERDGGREGDAFGALRLRRGHRHAGDARERDGRAAVEGRELWDVYPNLDVASDAALGECERHPGLEMTDDPWLHLRMSVE